MLTGLEDNGHMSITYWYWMGFRISGYSECGNDEIEMHGRGHIIPEMVGF
jgi:hypothetical protein